MLETTQFEHYYEWVERAKVSRFPAQVFAPLLALIQAHIRKREDVLKQPVIS